MPRHLIIRRCSLERLPGDLIVAGDLIIESAPRLRALPGDLQVGGSVRVSRCPLFEAVESGLHVGTSLTILNCAAFVSLPIFLERSPCVYHFSPMRLGV